MSDAATPVLGEEVARRAQCGGAGPSVCPDLKEIGLDRFAPYLMNRIMARYNEMVRQNMAGLGLSTAKMRVLAALSVEDGLKVMRLAVHAVTEPSTLSRTLDALEAEGLVQRRADPGDNRATCVHLTRRGERAFARIWPSMADTYRQMFAGISTDDQTAFVRILGRMLVNIRHHEF